MNKKVVAAFVVLLVSGVAGWSVVFATGSIPADGAIHGCFKNHATIKEAKGGLRVVSHPAKCRGNETPLSWNQPHQSSAPEVWRLGASGSSDPPTCAVFSRVVVTRGADFHSNFFGTGATNLYWAFPAAASENSVRSANFYITDRSGSYTGDATITLEVLDCDGNLQHTVSASSIDMETSPANAWTSLTLSGDPLNLVISPGEFLAVHFALSGAAGGNLVVRPMFDVEVQ